MSGADLSTIALSASSDTILFFSAAYPGSSCQELPFLIPILAGSEFLLIP